MDTFFIALASLIHVYTFMMETFLWGKPRTNRTFGMSPEMAAHNQLFAFNQGFYNLFLALGAGAGIVLGFQGAIIAATTLKVFTCLSMLGASLVLLYSKPKLIWAVLAQGLPPFLGLTFLTIKMWL
jgi:putative membrane protein